MPKPRKGPPSAAELEGFLEGLQRRLEDEQPGEGIMRAARRTLRESRRHVRENRLRDAEALLEGLAAKLDVERPIPGTHEFPRGLVGFVPRGPPEGPVDPREDSVANRILLVGRLIPHSARTEEQRARLVARLREAEEALRGGDRARAKRLTEALLGEVEPRRGPVG